MQNIYLENHKKPYKINSAAMDHFAIFRDIFRDIFKASTFEMRVQEFNNFIKKKII